jgi:hypothetical protein
MSKEKGRMQSTLTVMQDELRGVSDLSAGQKFRNSTFYEENDNKRSI